eukprot:3880541-Pyramimonas_sp.AAC.1
MISKLGPTRHFQRTQMRLTQPLPPQISRTPMPDVVFARRATRCVRLAAQRTPGPPGRAAP